MVIIKKFIIIFLEIIVLVYVFSFVTKASTNNTLFYIYIDPGHGGFDGGTVALDKSIIEKDITLDISLLLASRLRNSGFAVELTRKKDESLGPTKKEDIHKRVDLINKSKATIYISIHANSYPSQNVHGAQVFYNDKNDGNKILANCIMQNLKVIDNTNKRTIHSIEDKYLTDNVTITGCLVEIGFLSNQYDLNNLMSKSYRSNLCEMIYIGILEYLDYLK